MPIHQTLVLTQTENLKIKVVSQEIPVFCREGGCVCMSDQLCTDESRCDPVLGIFVPHLKIIFLHESSFLFLACLEFVYPAIYLLQYLNLYVGVIP